MRSEASLTCRLLSLQSLELSRETRLRRGTHAINKKHPVQVIHLMLQGPREEPGRLEFDVASVDQPRLRRNARSTHDFRTHFRKAEASFVAGLFLGSKFQLGIEQHQWHPLHQRHLFTSNQ